MNRRDFLAGLGAGGLVGLPAFAQDFADSVVSQLRRQGFSKVSTERTLLGRVRIVATGNGGRREIILNPRTGEILRDLWELNGAGTPVSGPPGASGGGGIVSDDEDEEGRRGRGRGRGRGGDDDSHDDSDSDSDSDSGSDSDGDSGDSDGDSD